jgi:hypothetical protein
MLPTPDADVDSGTDDVVGRRGEDVDVEVDTDGEGELLPPATTTTMLTSDDTRYLWLAGMVVCAAGATALIMLRPEIKRAWQGLKPQGACFTPLGVA